MVKLSRVDGTIVERANGNWEARLTYTDPTTGLEQRRSFYCKTEMAAKNRLSAARSQLLAGEQVGDPSALSLKDWLAPLAKGIASYIPGLYTSRSRRGHLRAANARYCYDVWLRHLIVLASHEDAKLPSRLAELGPGGSLGVGLAALLSGVDTYYALDIIEYSEGELNDELLDDLIVLYKNRTPVDMGWLSDSPVFPDHILTEDVLRRSLAEPRLQEIRFELSTATSKPTKREESKDSSIQIEYIVPWHDPAVIRNRSVDLIVSQSVLEHVNDLPTTYDAFARWLRPGGYVSNLVDFSCHGLTRPWNGHWRFPELAWKVIVGNKPYLINREPCSTHLGLLRDRGFEVKTDLRYRLPGLGREQLSPRWFSVTDDDLLCASALIQAQLPTQIS